MSIRGFAANRLGRDLFVGDVHGHASSFQQLLVAARFNPERDRVFSTGDLTDRGPDSVGMLLRLDREPWFHAVLGNHEAMLLATAAGAEEGHRQRWMSKGGGWYFGLDPQLKERMQRVVAGMPLAIEIAGDDYSIGVVHAELPVDGTWEELARIQEPVEFAFEEQAIAPAASALWGRRRATAVKLALSTGTAVAGALLSFEGPDLLVCGHTPTPDAQPRLAGRLLYVDTGVYLPEGQLSLVDVRSDRFWQIDQRGRISECAGLPRFDPHLCASEARFGSLNPPGEGIEPVPRGPTCGGESPLGGWIRNEPP